MAIIYTYPSKAAAAQDKVLISDSADENKTKNASIDSIRDAINVVDVISAGSGISVSNPTGNVTIGNTGVLSLTAGSNISLSGSTGNITISTSASNVDGSGTTNRIPIWTDSNTLGDSQISQNAFSIGIGTALGTSTGSLEVYSGSANNQIFVTAPDTGQAGINFGGTSNKTAGLISYSDNSDLMMFHTNNSEKMRILSNGNLGVGTTVPSAKLEVNDSSNDIQMRVGSLTAGISPIIRFQGKNTTNTTNYFTDIALDATLGELYLNDPGTSSGSIGQNPVIIDSTGSMLINNSLGIGAPASAVPAAKLVVSGQIETKNITINGDQGTNNQVITSSGSGISWQTPTASISGSPGVVPVFDTLGTGITNSSLITTGSGSTQTFQFNTLGNVTFDGTILATEGGTFSNSDLITESTSTLHIKGALKDGGNSTGSQDQLLSSNGVGEVKWRPAYNNGTINAGCASVGSSSNIASNPRQAAFTFPNEVGSSNFGQCIPIMAPLTVQLIAIKWNGANAPTIGANGTVDFKLGKLTSRTGNPDTQEGTVNYTNLVDLTGLQITSADSGTWIYKFMNLAGTGATYVAQDIMVLLFPRPTTGWTGTGATNGDIQVTMQVAYVN